MFVTGALALLVGVAAVADGLRNVVVSSDTIEVIVTADQALAHLRHGQLQHWGGDYALLQALPAFVLRAAGTSVGNVVSWLVGLNILSFAAIVWVSWRGLVRQAAAGAVFLVAVLLSSTLLWYLHASLGEPLAAAVTLGAVVASWHGRGHLAAAGFLFLAGLSKDSAVPFLLLLCVATSVGNEDRADRSWCWRRLAWLLAAGALSLLVSAAYNYARFGSLFDVPYLTPSLYVPWATTEASFFAAVWLSPNGGLLPFWPSFGVLLVLAAIAAFRATRSRSSRVARLLRAAPALAAAAVLVGLTVGLARWVSPLGWVAWGSRLMLPWVPAVAYLLVTAYHEEIEGLLRGIARAPLGYWLGAIVLAVASLPQYVAMVRPTLFQEVFITDAACPNAPYIEGGPVYYYDCTNHMLWTKQSMLISAFEGGPNLVYLVIGCACAAGLLWLLYRLRATVTSARRSPPPAAVAAEC